MKAPRVETDPPFGFSLALPITQPAALRRVNPAIPSDLMSRNKMEELLP
jgi:hypothetical protein